MALRALMLRKKIDTKRSELNDAVTQIEGLATREAELETAINEAETEEERSVVEDSIAEFERDKENLEQIKANLESAISDLEAELEGLEDENEPEEDEDPEGSEENNERKVTVKMEYRALADMNLQERDAFFKEESMQTFLGTVRTAIAEKRAITNAGLLIPEKLLPMIRLATEQSSKLIGEVTKVVLKGTGRELVQGTMPEAVWTEMCATLNELSIGFNDVEIDGYKVGGYFMVCNAQIEDSDYDLASILVTTLGQAIGLALDKAILYGTGTKMPLGIVTRLAQTAAPSGYPATARAWADLHTKNIVKGTASLTGEKLLAEIIEKSAVTSNDYYAGNEVWIMNPTTKKKLMAATLSFNAAGAIVSGISNTMPVIGGKIIELPFVPDNNIIFGHLKAYLLGERKGIKIGSSEHYKFIEDKTVIKGTARYDGTPVIAEAFGVYGMNNTAPATTVTFAADAANAVSGQ